MYTVKTQAVAQIAWPGSMLKTAKARTHPACKYYQTPSKLDLSVRNGAGVVILGFNTFMYVIQIQKYICHDPDIYKTP